MKKKITLSLFLFYFVGAYCHTSPQKNAPEDAIFQTTFLVEHFTASSCGPCVPNNAVMNPFYQEQSAAGQLIYIKYHMSFPSPGDPYYVAADAGERSSYYRVGGVPFIFGNGSSIGGNPPDATLNTLKTRLNGFEGTKSFYDIAFDSVYISQVGGGPRDIYIGYTITSNLTEDVTIHTVVLEGKTYGNVTINGETEFQNVVMKMFPNGKGHTKLMEKGNTYPFVYEYDMNNTFVETIDDLSVVVFIQNDATKEVLAAAQRKVGHSPIVATPEISIERVGDSALVTITCATKGATIHYSLTDRPTTESTPYTTPFWIYTNTTVRAIAADGLWADSDFETKNYGFVVEPSKISADQTSDGLMVTIINSTEGATIHYTTNGEDPTANSPIYKSPFVVNPNTVVRAMGVKTDWTNSPIVSLFVQSPSSNKDIEAPSLLKIHPNPTSDGVNIDYPELAQLFLYNINGVLIYEGTVNGSKKLSMAEYPNGTYVLKVVSDRGIATERIVKR
jgi:hypothetical protein